MTDRNVFFKGRPLGKVDSKDIAGFSGWKIERDADGVWAKDEDTSALVRVRSDGHGEYDVWIWGAPANGQAIPFELIRHLEKLAREEGR